MTIRSNFSDILTCASENSSWKGFMEKEGLDLTKGCNLDLGGRVGAEMKSRGKAGVTDSGALVGDPPRT